MTRIAAVLAAAALGSGCIITTDDGAGSVNVYWDFLRNAPADPEGWVLYDPYEIDHGVGVYGPCEQSGVEEVDVIVSGGSALPLDCIYNGIQGITLDGVPEGSQSFRIRAYRDGRLLWDHAVSANVVDGGVIDVFVDTEPVIASIEMVAFFHNIDPGDTVPDFIYATCNEADNPDVSYQLWDSAGTLVDEDTVLCPAGASAFGLPVVAAPLDLDTYTVRMQGDTGFADPSFDSCTAAGLKYLDFDHYATQVGVGAVEIDLFTPPPCSPAP